MKPVLQALLMADHVYTDKVTGKKIVAGIFHRLLVGKPPAAREVKQEQGEVQIQIPAAGHQSGSPFCYFSLTELRGQQPFALRYVRLGDDKVLFKFEFSIKCDDPLETVDAVIPLPALPFNSPGVFALELLWNEEPLGSHRITVAELEAGGERNDG